jgi:hypothetical protein
MTAIPRMALFLGLAGLTPFLWGAASELSPRLNDWGARVIGPRFVGPHVSLAYGTVILAFMSGALWGFAARAGGRRATLGYLLSVCPALWAFFLVGGGPVAAATALAAGFAALLPLDALFQGQGLAPPWWLRLRLMLMAVVLACLAVPILG